MPTDYTPLFQGLSQAGAAFGRRFEQDRQRQLAEEERIQKGNILNSLIQAGQPQWMGPLPEGELPPGLTPFQDLPAPIRQKAGRFADIVQEYQNLQKASAPQYKVVSSGTDLLSVGQGQGGGVPAVKQIYKGTPKVGNSRFGLDVRAGMESGLSFNKAVERANKLDFERWLQKTDISKLNDKDFEEIRQKNRERSIKLAHELGLETQDIAHKNRLAEIQLRSDLTKDSKGKYTFKTWYTATGRDDNAYSITTSDPLEIKDWIESRLRIIDDTAMRMGEAGGLFGIGAENYTADWEKFKNGELDMAELPVGLQGYAKEWVTRQRDLIDLNENQGLIPAEENKNVTPETGQPEQPTKREQTWRMEGRNGVVGEFSMPEIRNMLAIPDTGKDAVPDEILRQILDEEYAVPPK